MHLTNEAIRQITIREDGSAEILYKDQTFMDIPAERISIQEPKVDQRNVGFIQGVAYAAGLVNRFGSNADTIIGESGIKESHLRAHCDEYDLRNLGLLIEEEEEEEEV